MAKMGGARVFFTVLARAQTDSMIEDTQSAMAIMQSVYLDSIEGVMESLDELFGAWTAFSDAMVASAEDVEYAKIHFEKFFDGTLEQAYELEEQLMNVGVAFGMGAADSIEAGARMMQIAPTMGPDGSGAMAAEGATEASMLMGAVGMMTTEDAMTRLMQLQMQTNFMYEGAENLAKSAGNEELKRQVVMGNTIKLVNMLNEAENNTGATIQGITFAMNQFAASAKLANMSMEEQIALSATLIEQGEEQGKAGRAIKMMLARLASDRSDNNALLAKHGVLVHDEMGNMKGLMEIMGELKTHTDAQGRSWDNLTSVEKQNIAIAVAGSHHYVRFLKLMEGYERAGDIQETVLNSTGSAMNEFSTFTENAAFNLNRYNQAIQNEAAITGNLLLPAKVEAAKAELFFARARNSVLETTIGKRASAWLTMANFGFQQAKGIMEAVFMFASLRVAMMTHNVLQQQMAHFTGETTKAKMLEAQANTMNSDAKEHAYRMSLMGIRSEKIAQEMGFSKIQVDAAINNKLVERAKLTQHTTRAAVVEGQTALGLKASEIQMMAVALRSEYGLSQAERKRRTEQIAFMSNKMKLDVHEYDMMQAQIRGNLLLSDGEKSQMNVAMASARAQIANTRINIALLQHELNMEQAMLAAKNGRWNADSNLAMLNSMRQQQDALTTEIQMIMNDSQMTNIKLTKGQIQMGMVDTKVTAVKTKFTWKAALAQMKLNAEMMKGWVMGGGLTSSLMLASMVLMMFTDDTNAAEAAMWLMMAAMIPMTLGMLKYAAAAHSAALGTSIATLGFAAVAGAAAYFLATATAGTSEMDKELQEMEESIKESEREFAEMDEQMKQWAEESEGQIAAVGSAFDEELTGMTDAMDKFDNKRMEIFFGGSRSRMDQALFREVKMNGVENLYFAPEVHMTNTFNGLTYNEAANQIAEIVLEKLEGSTGAQQLSAGY